MQVFFSSDLNSLTGVWDSLLRPTVVFASVLLMQVLWWSHGYFKKKNIEFDNWDCQTKRSVMNGCFGRDSLTYINPPVGDLAIKAPPHSVFMFLFVCLLHYCNIKNVLWMLMWDMLITAAAVMLNIRGLGYSLLHLVQSKQILSNVFIFSAIGQFVFHLSSANIELTVN